MSVRLRSDVRYRLVADEAIVIRQRAAEVLVLNEVGARILELLSSDASLDELVASLSEDFDVEQDVLRQDVADFLKELIAAEVLEEASA